MQTGEDIQGLRKIIDFTRLISLFILSIHFISVATQHFSIGIGQRKSPTG